MAHDLKTPLRGMATLSELMAEEIEEIEEGGAGDERARETLREYLARTNVQIARMHALIGGLHDYSTAGLGEDLVTSVDTRRTVLDIADALSVRDDRLVLTGDFPTFTTFAVRLEQTLANLIGNAFKYHDDPAHARVEVSVSSFGDFYAFSVRDDGPGIAAKHHQRIFEVFQSVRRDGVESSGVGLAIVKKAVESLGGMIGVESVPGEGSTFRFLWPKSIDSPSEDSA